MAIQLFRLKGKSYSATASKQCRSCGEPFAKNDRRYRIDVSVKGRRIIRFTHSLAPAGEIESSPKTDMLRKEFDITAHKPNNFITFNHVWERYLPSAREHKKTWRDDDYHYGKHIQPRFAETAFEMIMPFEIER